MLFDTHTHINVSQFDGEVDDVLERAYEHKVSQLAVVGFDTKTIKKSLELSQTYDNIYSIIGWHPTEAGKYTREIERTLQEQLALPKVVALGEIGLDYYWNNDPKDVQENVFRRQIAIAREMNLPISIHTREAMEDTYKILKSERFPGGIIHSFSGNIDDMQRFLDLGMYISLSGVVTFKKAYDLHEVAKQVDFDKLLIETDAPYLSPVPYRGKRNEPAYVYYVAEKIAQLRGCSFEDVAHQTSQNARKLFKL
ncbi:MULTISPECIES: TatD family hydrolase [unclassified Granulicatella]|uniref:TatD family hydrolase n=1 Tax=unclassified Granulicatella TaxID=2630493 RepID=UPI0010732618|nr:MULTISPECIES: TatD family hydrolase [unclassified Granulicatella]MBF0779628.1 TatD family hydrolase [Granulicatella sp. 19428wC4_WM01]TFU96286.1 TatD family deoxyribonuclease [Granulicatella sp. WM01]